jgi:hypothetical protein
MTKKLSDEEIYDLVVELNSKYKGNPSVQLEHSDVWLRCHLEGDCHGEYCTMHKRSDHSMRSFPQHWRDNRGIMERICPHNCGHPDPDQITDDRTHGCDGCCSVDGYEILNGKEVL